MTTYIADTFEGDLSAWTDDYATPTISTTQKYSGNSSLYVNPSAWDGEYVYKSIAGAAIVHHLFYVYITGGLPSTNNYAIYFCGLQNTNDSNAVYPAIKRIDGANYWVLAVNNGGAGTTLSESTASNPQLNTWYCVEYVRDITNQTVTLLIDGIVKISQTITQTGSTNIIICGIYYTDDNGTVTAYLDDTTAADTAIGTPITRGLITIAFDDGLKNVYTNARSLLNAKGFHATFYLITDSIYDNSADPDFLSVAELTTLQNDGHEIGNHSKTHPNFTGLTEEQIRTECSVSQTYLQTNGFPSMNFAYPYGARNATTDSIVADYFTTYRSAYDSPYLNEKTVKNGLLLAVAGETGNPTVLTNLQSKVMTAYTNDKWVIIFFHSVADGDDENPYGIATADFSSFIDWLSVQPINVKSVAEVIAPLRIACSRLMMGVGW